MKRKRKSETSRTIVKWIVGGTMYFREYKRDAAAVRFASYLIEVENVSPEDVRLIMK
jgi:hypothetical protein